MGRISSYHACLVPVYKVLGNARLLREIFVLRSCMLLPGGSTTALALYRTPHTLLWRAVAACVTCRRSIRDVTFHVP
eukprot:203367-Rhodomonas_salina.12